MVALFFHVHVLTVVLFMLSSGYFTNHSGTAPMLMLEGSFVFTTGIYYDFF